MAASAQEKWDELAEPWRVVFDQAWDGWQAGSLGIGASLVDPATEEIVSVGRNRTAEERSEIGVLAGNFMAHAEMNAIAELPRFKADGLHLYTTLEPCLMCAATATFMHVDTVFFASADPYFAGLDDLWDHHPYSRKWKTTSIGPLESQLADFSMVLHMTGMKPDNNAFDVLANHNQALADLSREVIADGTFAGVSAAGGTTVDALAAILSRLPQS